MLAYFAPRFLRKLFARTPVSSSIRPRTKRSALRMESLEDRTNPSTTWNVTPSTYIADIAAAKPGDTVQFTGSDGPYTQAIVVNTNNLTLLGGTGVVIEPSSVTVPSSLSSVGGAAIDLYGQNDVVRYFTVNGQDANGTLWSGIRVIENGSATITNNTVENITNASNPIFDIGIQIGSHLLSGGTTGYATAKVNSNTIETYAGAGLLVDGSGAIATVVNNTITGRGTGNNGVSEYGVQLSYNASARVQGNTITGNTISGNTTAAPAPNNPPVTSAGIFVFDESGHNVVIALNYLSGNDDGVLVQASDASACSGGIQIVNNTITGNFGFAGIYVLSSNNVLVAANLVYDNLTYNGIALVDTDNVTVESNDVYSNGTSTSATDGIYDEYGTSDAIDCNNSYSNTGNGINLNYTKGDSIFNNLTWSNSLNGIQDYEGANDAIWLGDAVINEANGIYLDETTGDTVVGNVLAFNGEWGLEVQGCTNTFIAENLVVDNSAGSIYITSTSSGTTMINNWTSSPPVKDGTSGVGGTSNAFTCAFSDADAAVASLCN